MKCPPEVTCIVCQQVFCCADCRRRHERTVHGLPYDCPICRENPFLCQPDQLCPAFLIHLQEHLPLHCSKCGKVFTTMDELSDIDKCTSLSELVDHSKSSLRVADERFDSLYEKIIEDMSGEEVEKNNKTAVITPIVRRKYLVDYEPSDTEPEDGDMSPKVSFTGTVAPKTPRLKRSATPHVKKLLLARQQALDEDGRGSPDLDSGTVEPEMTTPNSRPQSLAAAALAVTTSTPTHSVPGGWAMFSTQTDSPLSEIEQADSPQPDGNRTEERTEQTEPEPTEPTDENTEQTEQSDSKPKLKSIISSRRVGSAESAEQDTRTKRVKFADGTVFQPEPQLKRVFRKPKRMLTPGPTKARFNVNPRFQALINRFEQNAFSPQTSQTPNTHRTPDTTRTPDTMARTPINNRQETDNVPRAIDFKDSPVELKNSLVEDNRDASFKSCVATPGGIDTAITALSTNIAGSLQTCISNVLKHTEEETEIQFKFTITKKKTVQRPVEAEGTTTNQEKENLWASVAKAVKSAFWGEGGEFETPHKSISSCSSSSSKRKQPDRSRSPSPLSHKRGKYEPRLRGRPPLRQGLPLTARLARHDVTSHSF
ncbi:proteoglycan 4-like [Cydia pomonella]|uniref:proteoglycan 4-like n=1 Tax=Cydia pomonella TaxID=82600 RepID=UPI002ADD37AD|nr:proteoglycan 4-like [Cydia pomonella]